MYLKLVLQFFYSIRNTRGFTLIWTDLFVHNFDSNKDILMKCLTDLPMCLIQAVTLVGLFLPGVWKLSPLPIEGLRISVWYWSKSSNSPCIYISPFRSYKFSSHRKVLNSTLLTMCCVRCNDITKKYYKNRVIL